MKNKIFHKDHTLWALAFRPFFLVGGIHAAIIMLAWLDQFTSWSLITWPSHSIYWHAHEMIYGFASAIISGFLLTATQNWAGIRGLHGKNLQWLVFIWLVPRTTVFIPFLQSSLVTAFFAIIYFPSLLVMLKPYLFQKAQKRNWIFVALICILFFGEILFYLEHLQLAQNTARLGIYMGLYTILTMITVIGGRVIPFFTKSAIPTAKINTFKWLDVAALFSTLCLGAAHLFFVNSAIFYWCCFMASLIHLVRWLTWDFLASLKKPILWILYVGYFWMIIGFFLLGLSSLGVTQMTTSLHALTAGAMGVVIIGMISRVSLGHTGRPIVASGLIISAYIAINLSVFIRVFGPIISADLYRSSLLISGILWTLGFLIFCIQYIPILLRPRLDGKAG